MCRDSAALSYDAVGNLTDDGETYEYVYDAFGRLVQVKNQSSNLFSQHRYNGLGYRIGWQYDLDADGTVETTGSNHDPWLYQVHDTSWRVVATVFAVDDGAGTEAGEYLAKADDDPRELFVFHTAGLNGRGTNSKLDDVILRDRDADMTWGSVDDSGVSAMLPHATRQSRCSTRPLPGPAAAHAPSPLRQHAAR